MTTLPDTQARAEQRERADSLREQLDDFIDRDGMWDTIGQAIDCIAAALAAEGLRQRLAEHKRGCTVQLGSCARCIELGDEDSIKIAQRQLAATQPGATGEEK